MTIKKPIKPKRITRTDGKGWTTTEFSEQPYNADIDFAEGDFSFVHKHPEVTRSPIPSDGGVMSRTSRCPICRDTGLIPVPGGYNTCTCAKGLAMEKQFGRNERE